MSKNIIFCADGTWNSSDQDENHDGTPDLTNVCKLFLALSGQLDATTLMDKGEQEKSLVKNGQITQVAKYIHGVGDSNNPIVKAIGGATGSGTIARIIRGYTYISRMYKKGDKIFIVGFSRGAYTARALAGMIAKQGLLKDIHYTDKESREKTYMKAAKVWYRHNNSRKEVGFLEKFVSALAYLPAFISQSNISENDLLAIEQIAAVGVWDTVGAMGIPEFIGDGQKYDAFRFADSRLSEKVARGFHAVALDERRTPFIPTLWDKANNVVQVLFPGAHSDVGGGYPEHQLSDIALCWMIDQLTKEGVLFDQYAADPNAGGIAHEPWASKLYAGKQKARDFTGCFIEEHPSIQQRCDASPVKPSPEKKAAVYNPSNRI